MLAFNSQAQNCIAISGRVVDTTHNPLPSAIVEIFFLGHTKFAVTNNQGFFKQQICYGNDSIYKYPITIKTKIIGYYAGDTAIFCNKPTIDLGSIVKYSDTKTLSEVIVKNKPITQNGDTTSFLVSAFKNKLDANLEDVLKKMPGFDIDANGAITYNNKPIEDILVEGDQLAKNYKLISKNINPEMIDKVEMVDKYNSNPVLKNLSNSRKQVMNLKLKNSNRLSAFGEVKAGIGIADKQSFTANLFALKAKIKTFAVLNANNTGQSPYDEVTSNGSQAESKDYEFDNTVMPNYITENGLFARQEFTTNSSVANNSLFNASKLAVVNNTIKLNQNNTIKLFTDVYKDDINKIQQNSIINNILPQFSYNEQIAKTFSPFNSNNNLQYKYLSKKIQIISAGTMIFKNYNEYDTIASTIGYQANLNSKFKRLGISTFITYRIDSTKAIEMGVQYSFDSKNQYYNLLQNATRKIDTLATNAQLQQTQNDIDYFKGEIKYLFKNKKNRTNILSLSNTYVNSGFNSGLNVTTDLGVHQFPKQFQNTIITKHNDMLLNYNIGFKIQKLDVVLDMGLKYVQSINKNLQSNTEQQQGILQLTPKFNLSYSINKQNTINCNATYNSDLKDLAFLSDNSILASYRSFNKNIPNIDNLTNLRTTVTYLYRNIDKATFLTASYFHSVQFQSNINSINFTKDFDFYTSRFVATPQINDNIYVKFDNYLYSINTAFSVKNTFSWFMNPTEINNKIVSSKNFNYNFYTSIRPTVSDNVNLNLGLDYRNNKDIESNKSTYQWNPFVDVMGVANKKLSLGIRCNYFNSNYAVDNQDYYFVNANIWYSIIPKKLEAKLAIVNILNQNEFYASRRNDIVTQFTTTQILPRFALLELHLKF